jgi:hypothetical protein
MDQMALWLLRCTGFVVAGGLACGQAVRIYSEFQRVDPFGNILAVDKTPRPREILSPAVVRSAFASFHLAVSVPGGAPFSLFFGQNPEGTLQITVYKEVYVKRGQAWIPDGLERLSIGKEGLVSDPGPRLPGQTTLLYWLDLWVPPATPVERIRLEAQVNVGDKWVVYPMEIRVEEPVLPAVVGPADTLAAVDAPADASARGPLRGYLCGTFKNEAPGPLTIRRLIRRNARQDLALARLLESKAGRNVLTAGLLRLLAPGAELKAWCEAPVFPQGQGAEWYLRVRDFLYRSASLPYPLSEPGVKVTITPVEKQP